MSKNKDMQRPAMLKASNTQTQKEESMSDNPTGICLKHKVQVIDSCPLCDKEKCDTELNLQSENTRLREALEKIACWNDTSASMHLEETCSYALFDEPNSVQLAREALQKKESES